MLLSRIFLMGEGSRQLVLPKGTPFGNWKEARRYAGPLPFAFTYNQKSKKILIIEGVKQNWKPKPIKIIEYRFSFLDAMNFEGIILANGLSLTTFPITGKKEDQNNGSDEKTLSRSMEYHSD